MNKTVDYYRALAAHYFRTCYNGVSEEQYNYVLAHEDAVKQKLAMSTEVRAV